MRFSSLKVCFLIAFSFFSSLDSFAQTTIDFNTLGDGLLTTSYSSGGFTFSINATNGRVIQSKATGGFSNSPTLYDNNPDIGAITRWTITKNDGAEFQFRSVYLRDAGFGASTSGTIQGFKNGTSTGSAEAITFGGTVELAGNSKFFDVDELRIQGSDINFFLDHFTYGSVFVPVDTDPTQVSSISVQGTPGPFATLVTYAVNFNKAALNVSIDDFQLTTTGSVSGTIASVSGSGSGYTVTVNNITGEGTLRLDLKSGTNITNTNGNTGTIAFASGSAHILSACVIETFESTVFIDAATSFSSNGRSFTLGTGLEIEDRRGFGAVNPGESGNSNKYIKNNNTSGSFTLSGAQDFTMNTIDVFLSNLSNGDNPTGVGSLIIRGKKDGTTLYTITKTSGFPTTSSNGNGGFFTINFATSGLGNYRNITIDQLEFTIADGFVALALDNFNFCHLAPDIDILAPKVISSIPDGAAFSNATSVNFEVVFDENAFNVSTDDFALATSGTATGTISAVSGNGSVYTVAVSGITGEGTLKVNLSAPNNIRDVLNNTGSPAFASGQEHLVGSCFIENFEDETSGATSFSGNGSNFTLVGNWSVNKEVPSTGIGGSKINLKHTGAGPYSIVSGDGLITVSRLALYLSSFASGTTPTNDGSVTIKGFNNNVEEFSVIKFSGFPTDFSSNNGYFFVNFATEQGQDNSKKLIDKLEITLGGSFVYLNLENFEWCTDILPPSDYSVTIDQDLINVGNQNAVSFTFAGAEIGTTYNYTLSSSGGGTNVTGSGLVSSATQQIAPIDLNGLGDGTITLSVTLTDAFSNVGDPATDTSTKLLNTVPIATAPSVPVVNEDDVNVALSDEIQISDAENDDQTVIFTITGGTLEIGVAGITFGSGTNGSASFTASGTLAAINTALDAATFTPTPDLFGATAGGISFTADDGIATSDPAAVTFEIIGVNDDPTFVGLPASITVVEDADIAYLSNALSDATFADVDAGNNTVMLILSVSAGTLNFANPQGVITITGFGTPTAHLIGTVANLEAYLSINTNAAYFPPLNLNGANAATLTVSANDGGHTGVGGGATVELGQIQIDITAVNDAPTVANPIPDQNATSGVAFNFQFAANAFNDVDADDVLTYTAQLNGGGALPAWLSFDAGTRTFSGTFGIDDAGSLSIEVIADDGNGGTVSDVFALTIEAVNGPPVISIPSAQTMNQNNVLVLSLGNGNQVSISDVDAGSNEVEISLTVTNGLITLASTTGLSFLAGDGAADQTMTFLGSIANINNALDGMNYSPSDGYNGPASLSVLVNDQGWTGSGGEQVASDVLHILVNSVNPVVTGVSSAVADGFYKIGDVIPILVSFDQAVDVSGGNPRLVLETGTVDRQAVYESGSGSNTLTFNYEVQSGDQTDDLDYQSTGSLVLSGATIQNQQGDDAILTLPGVGTPASLSGQAGLVIDGIRPEVTITLSRTELKVDEYLPVTFTFSEVVYGYDNADLTVENGTLSSVSSEDGGLTWTANLFPNANVEQASNLIALDNSGYRDYAGNTERGLPYLQIIPSIPNDQLWR